MSSIFVLSVVMMLSIDPENLISSGHVVHCLCPGCSVLRTASRCWYFCHFIKPVLGEEAVNRFWSFRHRNNHYKLSLSLSLFVVNFICPRNETTVRGKYQKRAESCMMRSFVFSTFHPMLLGRSTRGTRDEGGTRLSRGS
jgi:hypothetical protein